MTHAGDFHDLLEQVRAGDPEAARLLVRTYEPAIRRAVRFRLTDPRLRTALDSMDICQSVFGAFFVRAATGAFELDRPEDLVALLVGIARNKLAAQVRGLGADCRDYRRAAAAGPDDLPAATPTPSWDAELNDLIGAVRDRLGPDDWRLVELRRQGWGWADIAAQVGEDQIVLRKRLSRAVERVSLELGLGGVDDE
jgi:RNA polymerase sigma-70 factor (ECF subfamily)